MPGNDLATTTRAQRSEASATPAQADTASGTSLSRSEAAASDIDMDRVNEVRQALSDGTLQISSARICEGMAASVLEMNGEAAG